MPTIVHGLPWVFACLLAVACTAKTDPPATSGGPTAPPTDAKGSAPAPVPALSGRTFVSTRVTQDGAPKPLVAGSQLVLAFPDDGGVHANAGCNSLVGKHAIEGGKLVLIDASQTEKGCPGGLLEQELWYAKVLQGRPAITVEGDALVLEGEGMRIEFVDRKAVTPTLELVGPTWTVDTIVTKDTASHAAWPKPATLVFGADGSLQVEAGCNGGRGTYRVAGNEITFESVGLTEMACADPLATELETAVSRMFIGPQPVTFEISGDRLSLRGKTGGLDLEASAPKQ